jgi:hypothetical protein
MENPEADNAAAKKAEAKRAEAEAANEAFLREWLRFVDRACEGLYSGSPLIDPHAIELLVNVVSNGTSMLDRWPRIQLRKKSSRKLRLNIEAGR